MTDLEFVQQGLAAAKERLIDAVDRAFPAGTPVACAWGAGGRLFGISQGACQFRPGSVSVKTGSGRLRDFHWKDVTKALKESPC